MWEIYFTHIPSYPKSPQLGQQDVSQCCGYVFLFTLYASICSLLMHFALCCTSQLLLSCSYVRTLYMSRRYRTAHSYVTQFNYKM